MSRFRHPLTGLARNRAGVAAIEFAFVLPVLVLLLLGGAEYCRVLSVYRKVTLTTRAVADLTTQYIQMSDSDVGNVLHASSQIMAPYDTTNLTIVLSQVTTDLLGISRVAWSRPYPSTATALQAGKIIVMPIGSTQPGTSVILSQVSYAYVPTFGASLMGGVKLTDRISMSPRLVGSVPLTGS